jgi:hypothetical protein
MKTLLHHPPVLLQQPFKKLGGECRKDFDLKKMELPVRGV